MRCCALVLSSYHWGGKAVGDGYILGDYIGFLFLRFWDWRFGACDE